MTTEFKMFLGYTAAMVASGVVCLAVSTSPAAALPLAGAGVYGAAAAKISKRMLDRIDTNFSNYQIYKQYAETGDVEAVNSFVASLSESEAKDLADRVWNEIIYINQQR